MKETNKVVGHEIKSIKKLDRIFVEETLGWETRRPVWSIVLDNGTVLFASQDEEGNGPGSMFVTTFDGEDYYLSQLKDEK